MSDEEYFGFRFGVRNLKCETNTHLLDLVNRELARAPSPQYLNGLELIELGATYVGDTRILNPNSPLKKGDDVRIHTSPRRFKQPPDLMERIVSETSDYLVIEKPSGLPLEPTVDNIKENLLLFLSDLRHQTLLATHRLELESSGLALLAKNLKAQSTAKEAFAKGLIQRAYRAYVLHSIPPGVYTNQTSGGSIESEMPIKVTSCEAMLGQTNLISDGHTTWRVHGEPVSHFYRLELDSTQSRPKEIRALLAKLGSPVLGDKAFGSTISLNDPATGKTQMALKALSIAITKS